MIELLANLKARTWLVIVTDVAALEGAGMYRPISFTAHGER
ncbi:MAG TPA: hypothetical protein VII93_07365 [Anaerolineales bacterium]